MVGLCYDGIMCTIIRWSTSRVGCQKAGRSSMISIIDRNAEHSGIFLCGLPNDFVMLDNQSLSFPCSPTSIIYFVFLVWCSFAFYSLKYSPLITYDTNSFVVCGLFQANLWPRVLNSWLLLSLVSWSVQLNFIVDIMFRMLLVSCHLLTMQHTNC